MTESHAICQRRKTTHTHNIQPNPTHQCALPVTPANVTKLPGALYGAIKGCVDLTNANELALWMMCSTAQNLPNGNFPETLKVPAQYNDLYINANGQIDYVLYTPSIVFDGFYQSCPTIEAYADPKTGRKTAKILKGTGFNTVYTVRQFNESPIPPRSALYSYNPACQSSFATPHTSISPQWIKANS